MDNHTKLRRNFHNIRFGVKIVRANPIKSIVKEIPILPLVNPNRNLVSHESQVGTHTEKPLVFPILMDRESVFSGQY